MSEEAGKVYTMADWLADCVEIPVSAGLVRSILAEREVSEDSSFYDTNKAVRELCKADLLWALGTTTPNRMGAVSDSDNGWSHSDGGYTLTEGDKKRLLAEANAIYGKYDEPTKGTKTKITITQHGISRTPTPALPKGGGLICF